MKSTAHSYNLKQLSPILLLLVTLCGFSAGDHNYLYQTSWQLNCIRIDMDTAYFFNDSTYTYKHNFKLNEKFIQEYGDSASVNDIAYKSFHSTRAMQINFYSDTLFVMTKIRSGGRIFPDELDSGHYKIGNDTLFLTLSTRNNYHMEYKLDRSQNIFYIDEKNTLGQQIYAEYKRTFLKD